MVLYIIIAKPYNNIATAASDYMHNCVDYALSCITANSSKAKVTKVRVSLL